jgi:hypothetical protein
MSDIRGLFELLETGPSLPPTLSAILESIP